MAGGAYPRGKCHFWVSMGSVDRVALAFFPTCFLGEGGGYRACVRCLRLLRNNRVQAPTFCLPGERFGSKTAECRRLLSVCLLDVLGQKRPSAGASFFVFLLNVLGLIWFVFWGYNPAGFERDVVRGGAQRRSMTCVYFVGYVEHEVGTMSRSAGVCAVRCWVQRCEQELVRCTAHNWSMGLARCRLT